MGIDNKNTFYGCLTLVELTNLSKFHARYFVYDEAGYFRYFHSYQIAFAVAYKHSKETNQIVFIHSTLNQSTECVVDGEVKYTQHYGISK